MHYYAGFIESAAINSYVAKTTFCPIFYQKHHQLISKLLSVHVKMFFYVSKKHGEYAL